MNKRIREIVEQAAKFSAIMSLSSEESSNELFIEMFTKLLVEECCDMLSKQVIMHDGYGYSQVELHKMLRTHFDVE